jgi:hypothetical protein
MRRAQRAFRNRKQAAYEAKDARIRSLEETIEKMSTVFMDMADMVINSTKLRDDVETLQKMRQAVQQFTALAGGAGGEDAQPAQEPIGTTSESYQSSHSGSSPDSEETVKGKRPSQETKMVLEQPLDLDENFFLGIFENASLEALQYPGNYRAIPPNPHGDYFAIGPLENTFGNGWIGQLPKPFILSLNRAHRSVLVQHPIASRFVERTLISSYYGFLNEIHGAEELIDRVFGFKMNHASRNELLFNMRWFLGPLVSGTKTSLFVETRRSRRCSSRTRCTTILARHALP